jgi:hypothetical protein
VNVIDRNAVAKGAAVGLLLFVPIAALRAVIDDNVNDFDHSGWAPVFAILLLVVYLIAGYVGGREAEDAPYSNGMVAAIGAFLLWIPIRIVIWALRDTGQGLVTGATPVFSVPAVFTQLVLAAALGAFGGWLAGRRAATAAQPTD